ncbi:MAG: hypothetical protein NWF04_00035 [Candidatus Bathyarchaeota archaeon]|nr:hypothetical protein [Candidatus Bathyarchaeota archaeon]
MNGNNAIPAFEKEGYGDALGKVRTTIGIRQITKEKMDKNRAPGQCYNGFIWQMIDLWERTNGNRS